MEVILSFSLLCVLYVVDSVSELVFQSMGPWNKNSHNCIVLSVCRHDINHDILDFELVSMVG